MQGQINRSTKQTCEIRELPGEDLNYVQLSSMPSIHSCVTVLHYTKHPLQGLLAKMQSKIPLALNFVSASKLRNS